MAAREGRRAEGANESRARRSTEHDANRENRRSGSTRAASPSHHGCHRDSGGAAACARRARGAGVRLTKARDSPERRRICPRSAAKAASGLPLRADHIRRGEDSGHLDRSCCLAVASDSRPRAPAAVEASLVTFSSRSPPAGLRNPHRFPNRRKDSPPGCGEPARGGEAGLHAIAALADANPVPIGCPFLTFPRATRTASLDRFLLDVARARRRAAHATPPARGEGSRGGASSAASGPLGPQYLELFAGINAQQLGIRREPPAARPAPPEGDSGGRRGCP